MKSFTKSAFFSTACLAVLYGIIACLYDTKLAVVYFGILVVGATVLNIVFRQFNDQKAQIERLEAQITELIASREPKS